MRKELQTRLKKDYPKFFDKRRYRGYGECRFLIDGIDCGDGWFEIIDEMFKRIYKLPDLPVFLQIKEKFGGLRVYYYGGHKNNEEIDRIIDQAESDSFTVCEFCPSRGKVVVVGKWFKTLCPKCAKKLKG